MLRVLDLFSGIGGFSLGLERTGGFKTVAFCEIDPYCQKVLAKHWPGVPIYDDVRELTGVEADVICGGFPCQDISIAGEGKGIRADRSGFWFEYVRLIGEVRPRFAIVENVAELLNRGMGDVLGSLAEIGYDAEWHCIPAAAIGAPHRRDRVWIIAYPVREGLARQSPAVSSFPIGPTPGEWRTIAEAVSNNPFALLGGCAWLSKPFLQRGDDGVSDCVDRLRALGNAVVPQIPELIGRAILAAELQKENQSPKERSHD